MLPVGNTVISSDAEERLPDDPCLVTAQSLPGGAFFALLKRDISLALRQRGDLAQPLLFSGIVTMLIPLGVGPGAIQLASLAPGMIWITLLLATLLATDSLFLSDFRDGSLEQLLLSPQPLWLLVLAKIAAHWLVVGLPITLFAPVIGLVLALPAAGFVPLMASLAIGTAALSVIGAIGAALTVALRKGGMLLGLLVMPLYLPVLIFGAGVVQLAVDGLSINGAMAIMGALLAFALLLTPFAAAALRAGING